MPSPENSDVAIERLRAALVSLPKKERIDIAPPSIHTPKRAISIREAVMSDSEILTLNECVGRVASTVTLACPPAIPIAVPGEVIDEKTILAFEYYGIRKCSVVK